MGFIGSSSTREHAAQDDLEQADADIDFEIEVDYDHELELAAASAAADEPESEVGVVVDLVAAVEEGESSVTS